jgi:hypothetical protein
LNLLERKRNCWSKQKMHWKKYRNSYNEFATNFTNLHK